MEKLITLEELLARSKDLRLFYLKTDNKKDAIIQITEFLTKNFETVQFYESFLCISSEMLKINLMELNNILNYFFKIEYLKWKEDSLNFKYRLIEVKEFSRKLIIMKRPNHIWSFYEKGDPITDDEMDYVCYFYKEFIQDDSISYIDFYDIDLQFIQYRLNKLLDIK